MTVSTRTLALCILFPAGLLAQDLPSFDGLAGGGQARASTATKAFEAAPIPAEYDLLISISDRTINRLTEAMLRRRQPKAGEAQTLKELQVSFVEGDRMVVSGAFEARATDLIAGGNFTFALTAGLSSGPMNEVDLSLEGAEVLEGGEEFLPPLGPQHVARQLRFFRPAIEARGDAAAARLHQTLHKGAPPEELSDEVNDLFSVQGNSLRLRILPRVLSPLLPAVKILWAGIQDRKLQVYAEF